jgi:hypothetical protein
MDDRPILEKNLEALVRGAALPDPARARRRFLQALAEPERRSRPASLGAMAASLLVCAAIFSAILVERRVPPAPRPAAPQVEPPAAAGKIVPTAPSEQDRTVSLTATLPGPRDRSPLLRVEGTADLPERMILKVSVHRLLERTLGARLVLTPETAASGITEVRAGRFSYTSPWEIPAPARVVVAVIDDFQREELKGNFGGRTWTFEFPGWSGDLAPRLSPSLREADLLIAEVRDLLSRIEAAVVTEISWKAAEPAHLDRARKLKERLEAAPSRRLHPASIDLLRDTVNALTGAAPHFKWEEGKHVGPVTYYAGGARMKDFRNQEFGLDRLRAYAGEAEAVAGRETALWAVKEVRRGGPRPPLEAVLLEQAAHAGLIPFAARLREASPEQLGALEAEIRGGAP